MGYNYYNTVGIKDKIRYRKDPVVTEPQREVIITAINQYIDNDFKWDKVTYMEDSTGQKYGVLVTSHSCKHCSVLDIDVTMGWWDNTVAQVTLESVPEDESIEDEEMIDKKEIKSNTPKPQNVVMDKVQLVKIIEGVQEKGICKDNFIITVLELWENIKTADTPEQQESE